MAKHKIALNYYIVVKRIKNKDHTVAGGLELNQDLDSELRYYTGEIVSIGGAALAEIEEQFKITGIRIEVGDWVDYDKNAGHQIRWDDDVPLHVLKLGNLVALHDED